VSTPPAVASSLPDRLQVGAWTVHPALNEIRHGGEALRLEPKVIELLIHLAGHPGEVVGREALLTAVWPGVIVGDDALTQAIIKLRRAFGDDARDPRYIETIPKRGYRLIAPVEHGAPAGVARAETPPADPPPTRSAEVSDEPTGRPDPDEAPDIPAAPGVPESAGSKGASTRGSDRRRPVVVSRWSTLVIASVVLAGVVVALLPAETWRRWGPAFDRPGAVASQGRGNAERHPMIAVLPITNLSGDPARDYFGDGITEDIIHTLGRFPALRVLSRNAVEKFRAGAAAAPEAVRAELGARYIVRGSLRESAGTFRIAIELSDAERAGVMLWADRFDGSGPEIFTIQDRIVLQIVGRLAGAVERLEQDRALARPPGSLEAYELVLRARRLLEQNNRSSNLEARELLARAVALDPGYAEAHVALGSAELHRTVYGWVQDAGEALGRAETLLQRAIALDNPGSRARAHALLAIVHATRGMQEEALVEADRALEINPSDAFVHQRRGMTLLYLGRLDEALASIDLATRLEPVGRTLASHFSGALANFALKRHAAALAGIDRALVLYPDASDLHALRAATLAELGRLDEARQAGQEVRRVDPFFEPELFGNRFVDPKYRMHLQEGLRKAGVGPVRERSRCVDDATCSRAGASG